MLVEFFFHWGFCQELLNLGILASFKFLLWITLMIFLQRLLRAVIYGSAIMAPLAHVHFNFLEWLVVEKVRSWFIYSKFNHNYSINFVGNRVA